MIIAHGFFNKFLTNSTVDSEAFRSISLISWMCLNFLPMGSDHFSVWPYCRLTFFVNGLVVSDMTWIGIFHALLVSRTPICVRPKITRAHSLAPSLRPIWNFSSLSSWYDAVNEIKWFYQYFYWYLVLEESASRPNYTFYRKIHSYIASENLLIRFGKGNLPCIEIVKNNFLIV